MEADGMVWLSRNFYDEYNGTVQNNLVSIGVHEIAHQWWFALVGNDQALEPWLDEALCTYSEWIFYKHTYPSLTGWWWNFRVKPFSPDGYVNISIYEGGSFRPYVNAVYLRGAYFMDALRLRVGDDAFYAFLKDYAARMSHRRATRQDFFTILAQHTGMDISGVVADYFR
jgi:aminopeptidase N